MKTIHLIFNAHLDPIWLWPWHAGVTEALATARSACDMLDEFPDLIFTRGESWFYEQIQRHDPATFDRIRRHIESGRWEITGGWFIQPDCNQPSHVGFEKQIELGKRYFQQTFGRFPEIAYNVDSFGHNAALPEIMRNAGQRYYVMMRPQEAEMKLPARLFRWRGHDGGPEVTTFRIAKAYTTPTGITEDHIRGSLENLPEGIDHTMCFVGLGDHGGGPSRAMVQWCRDHAEAFDGARLVFSSPSRFFAAIGGQSQTLPLVTGELQMHAVGCYSIARQIKTRLRKAETMLTQIDRVMPDIKSDATFDQAWRRVCFHHFHDTLGGTCIPSAYGFVEGEIAAAGTTAEEILRRKMIDIAEQMPPEKQQRMVIWNPGPARFSGYIEHEPWLEWTSWSPNRRLEDSAGRAIPYQVVASEALVDRMTRLLFPCDIAPGEVFVARFDPWQDPSVRPATVAQGVQAEALGLSNQCGTSISLKPGAAWSINHVGVAQPELMLIPDGSDTWSHGLDRFSHEGRVAAIIHDSRIVDTGPLMGSVIQSGVIGESHFDAEWRVYAGDPSVHLLLHIEWVQRHQLLKLIWKLPADCAHRDDGNPGGTLRRAADGRELPLRDLTRVQLANGQALGVVCPDTFALDGDAGQIGFTMLRSPVMAHHEPASAQAPRRRFSDRGEHAFHFVFTAEAAADVENLEAIAGRFWMPPLVTDLTRGMPKRLMRCD